MRSLKKRIAMEKLTILALLIISVHIQKTNTAEIDIISDLQFLTEEDTMVSPARTFELGFFSPGSSRNRYLGIWYKKITLKTVVWVANRNLPIIDVTLGLVRIVSPGNLVLVSNGTDVIWSSNTASSEKAIVELNDDGNLVMTNRNHKIIWQSFDFPTDTLLPAMKLGKDFTNGKEWNLSSWKSSQDPAPGEFTWNIDTRGYPQHLLRQGVAINFRGGPWNGLRFSGDSQINKNTIYTYNMVINETEVTYSYNLVNKSVVSRFTLNSSGRLERSVWVEDGKRWQVILALPKDTCDEYNTCGAYGSCSTVNSQSCSCLDETKFVPRSQKDWDRADWSGGCVRRTTLDCRNGSDGFIKYLINVKLPDTQTSWYNMTMSLMECKEICQQNCTCMAYANTDIRGAGSGCLLWFNDLTDIRVHSEGIGTQDLYVRMASSELVTQSVLRKEEGTGESLNVGGSHREAMELPLFRFSTVAKATNIFSPENKLGEGGFGPVYKGMLEEGQEIAVKRLSQTSSQGIDEFKNEVICISKLQHRNLVKLLGCSIEGDERLLIYEYMPNRGLDSFIFDKMQSALLDWTKRFNIIKGIARGLLYLHQDSRLRIIHRDLKASNILLDLDMNPKISDFGIARSFGGNETQASTERVVGTYGYMSPEYALDGLFSTKSDVFSFGVLVLEIVSGRRNRGFVHIEHNNNLIGHAWRMHSEGRSIELLDKTCSESSNASEILRSIEVGLLCVQQCPEDRPDMSSVVLVLGTEGALPKAKQPAFFTKRKLLGVDFSSSSYPTSSTNDVTVTEIIPR
ncbi:G-type lectin S-receptor-like serine/threonine-protein kinase [Tanacetum coccineum]